jgi:hypothetical protein
VLHAGTFRTYNYSQRLILCTTCLALTLGPAAILSLSMETSSTQDTIAVELGSVMSKRSCNTENESLCKPSDEESRIKPDAQPKQPHDRHGLIVTFVLQLACFLWLAPIVTLLTFNFTPFIIGASAWCPHHKCNPGLFTADTSTTIKNTHRFDEQDHNLLGALQFVAKLLEIWFTLIAAALVSKMTFWLARKDEGLPIGLLTRPSGFADLPGTLEPLVQKARRSSFNPKTVWKSTPSVFNRKRASGKKSRRWPIRFFVILTAILCVVCNLMGPAVAVLVLPTLRWLSTPPVGDRTFNRMGADDPPQPAPDGSIDRYFSWSTECTGDDFVNLALSCATDPYASKLDAWIDTYIASGNYGDGLTQEWSVKFRVNQTYSVQESESIDGQQNPTVTWWTPCRQLLSSLDDDLGTVQTISQGYSDTDIDEVYGSDIERRFVGSPDTYTNYNNSLRLILERKGPILGAIVQIHHDRDGSSTWTSKISDDRSIRCYRDYDLLYAPFHEENLNAMSSGNFTKCVRVGSGWSELNRYTNFTIAGEHDNTTNVTTPSVKFSIFSSDKAQFFANNILPSWLPLECLQRGDVPSTTVYCDWDRLFHTDPDAVLYNRTQNVTTIEMSTKQANTNNTDGQLSRLTVDFVTFLNFTTYEMDASLLTNPAALVTTQTLPTNGTSILVHPTWMLAAWTVDQYGTLRSNRTATKEVLQTMKLFSSFDLNSEDALFEDLDSHISYISLLPVTQALSMIDYTTTAHRSTKAANAENERDPTRPRLFRTARMYVWAYGVNGRTSKFGIAVAIAGIVIVLAQTTLGFVDRRKPPSLDQLLVAALEYAPRDDFHGFRDDDYKVTKTRFRLREEASKKGQYFFKRPGVGM